MGWFKRDVKIATEAVTLADLGNSPITAFDQAKVQFYEIYGASTAGESRWFVFSMVEGLIIAALAITLYNLIPLKTVVPYMVTTDARQGAVVNLVSAENFKPDATVKQYFLTRWVEQMLTLDPYLTQKNIRSAYALTRDKATAEFTQFLQADRPMENLYKNPALTRVVNIISINPGNNDGIAFINIETEKRSGAANVEKKRAMITIHYSVIPPKDELEIRANPIGMYITHFVIAEEINK